MKKSIFLLFLILLSFSVSYSQDTVSLYFEVNNFSLSNHNKIVMDSLFETYTAHDLDSIYFIGMTDSVGHLKSNLKLSQKRSNSVKTYFSTDFSDHIPYSNFALGENNTKSLKESRRVDVL